MLKRLVRLANKLDSAGLYAEADLAEKIMIMAQEEDPESWYDDGPMDSMSEAEAETEYDDELEDEFDEFNEMDEGSQVESLLAKLEAFKGMVEDGLIDESELIEVEEEIDGLMTLYLGGGPAVFSKNPSNYDSNDAFGGKMELGNTNVSTKKLPVAEASRRRRAKR